MLTADQAAEIARAHGLSLADAVSLRALCDDEDHAEGVAARFVEADERSVARALFGTPDDPPEPPADPATGTDADDNRQAARDLFH